MASHTYHIEVEGELSPRYAAAFTPMHLDVHDGRTTIVGMVQDQAQLLGLIDHIDALGITLLSINPADVR